ADEETAQIEPRSRRVRPAEADGLPGRVHDLEPLAVAGRHALLVAVERAGVLGVVATERALALARRIRLVAKPLAGHCPREAQVDQSGLDHRVAVLEVDVLDLPHTVQVDDEAIDERSRSAAEPRPRPARHEGQAVAAAPVDDEESLIPRLEEHDRERRVLVEREAVALVDAELARVGDQAIGRDPRFELGERPAGRRRHGSEIPCGLFGDRVIVGPPPRWVKAPGSEKAPTALLARHEGVSECPAARSRSPDLSRSHFLGSGSRAAVPRPDETPGSRRSVSSAPPMPKKGVSYDLRRDGAVAPRARPHSRACGPCAPATRAQRSRLPGSARSRFLRPFPPWRAGGAR